MHFPEYENYDGLALAELVRNKQVTALELVETAIERIERHNKTVNAVVYKAYDEARKTADTEQQDGILAGVPFLMKDLGRPVKGWVSTGGSYYASNKPADHDCIMVKRYRETGAVLLGSTNTPEFGIPGITTSRKLGPCKNPWNPEHHAGGASGGAAATVAAGMVPVAHGSDGGGSIRIPAACCGLVGLKPTRHRNPVQPDSAWQLREMIEDHVLSRSLRDSAAILDATGYRQAGSPYAQPWKEGSYLDELQKKPERLKIHWSCETSFNTEIDPEISNCLENTAQLLSELGHDVVEETSGNNYAPLYREMRISLACLFAGEIRGLAEHFGRDLKEGDLDPLAQRLYDYGCSLSAAEGFQAFQKLRMLSWALLEKFKDCDVYLTPVMGTLPPKISEYNPLTQDLNDFNDMTRECFPFTAHFNVTGQPSISLPLWQSKTGLPIGMLFTANYAREDILFRLAGQLERTLPWKNRKPPMIE